MPRSSSRLRGGGRVPSVADTGPTSAAAASTTFFAFKNMESRPSKQQKKNPSKNNSKTNPKGACVNQQPNPKGARVNQPQASASTTSKRKRGEGEDDEVQIISVSAGPNATNTPQLVKRLSDKKQVHLQQPRTKADRDQLKRDGKINGYWKLPKGRPPKPKMARVPMLANN